MSLSRDDWRSLSGILIQYRWMISFDTWGGEPDVRSQLAVWLRDHDCAEPLLENADPEAPRLGGVMFDPQSFVEIDLETGMVSHARLCWVAEGPARPITMRGRRFWFRFEAREESPGRYRLSARVEPVT